MFRIFFGVLLVLAICVLSSPKSITQESAAIITGGWLNCNSTGITVGGGGACVGPTICVSHAARDKSNPAVAGAMNTQLVVNNIAYCSTGAGFGGCSGSHHELVAQTCSPKASPPLPAVPYIPDVENE